MCLEVPHNFQVQCQFSQFFYVQNLHLKKKERFLIENKVVNSNLAIFKPLIITTNLYNTSLYKAVATNAYICPRKIPFVFRVKILNELKSVGNYGHFEFAKNKQGLVIPLVYPCFPYQVMTGVQESRAAPEPWEWICWALLVVWWLVVAK